MIRVASPSRRLTTRVATNGDVWVYWQCGVRADVSRVRDISAGGMFLELDEPLAKGEKPDLHFLVQEGSIRAQTEVRRFTLGDGLGLKFLAIERECGHQLTELLARLRVIQRSTS
ncbi:MAG: hypothetical protein NVS9B14_00370 [Candidatus Acidiferrum sp.]